VDISSRIITLRGQKVILDADLAKLYGVTTKRFKEQVRRNIDRFPSDFMFVLTIQEGINLRSQFATSSSAWGGTRYPPMAFTEHGALMASNVLNSVKAAEMSIYVIRAFVRMRQAMAVNEAVARRLAEIESTLLTHDSALRDIYAKIRPLLLSPEPPIILNIEEMGPDIPAPLRPHARGAEEAGIRSKPGLLTINPRRIHNADDSQCQFTP